MPAHFFHRTNWLCRGTVAPLVRPVEVYPFALMDARTASEKDLCVFEPLGSIGGSVRRERFGGSDFGELRGAPMGSSVWHPDSMYKCISVR